MKKFWRSLTVLILATSSLSVLSTQTANAGIETDIFCAINFNQNVAIQPVPSEPAFTYETKYALTYDNNNAGITTTNSNGGVVIGDHTSLLGTTDSGPGLANRGLQIFYNTQWTKDIPRNAADNSVLFVVGSRGGFGTSGNKLYYFNNPDWKFPNFTKEEGSSRYIHIALVRNQANQLTIFFDGKAPTRSYVSNYGETGDYASNWNSSTYVNDTNTYSHSNYFGTDGFFFADPNPKSYVSGIKLVTGHNLYDPTASTITVPSNTTMKTVSATGSTPLLLNSQTAPTVVTNSGNAGLENAVMMGFASGGVGCPAFADDSFIGGDGVYNVYYKEGNVLKDSGSAPKIRDFYYSEDASPAAITITDAGTMVKAGNTFIGWNTQSDGSGQTYRAGDSYRPTNNATLYTKWSTPKTVTYYNGGGSGTLPTESNKLWEDQFEIPANTLTNGVRNFNGWNDGNGNLYAPGSTFTVGNSNVTLTAQWSDLITISAADVSITAPVAGETPVTSTTSNGQYTTAITWSDSPVTFAYDTVYTATVTVTPLSDHTLTGVRANLFTVNGNSATTANSPNAGVFAYRFPRTLTATTVSIADISIAAPATNATPVTSTTSNGQYTTTIAWSDSPSTFASNTVYTATVTVTPEYGYTLSGVDANFFTVNGVATTSGNLADAGSFTRTFAATATTISIADISITAPVTGATPVTSTTSNGEYTTTILWSESHNPFLNNTMYTATVTVIPDSGYTLSGVPANFFTVNGAATTTGNPAEAGSFTQIFAATTTTISIAEIPIAAPVTGQSPSNFVAGNGEYIAYIVWSESPSTFLANTVYTATVTVVPEGGYTLSGLPADFFTVNGAAATTGNLVDAGSFTHTFAATATTISTAAISLTAPATGVTPVTSTVSNGQFSTTITWSPEPGTPQFSSNTVYTATITVTPDSGYTLSGVSANFFTIDGASSVTNDPDSGVVTAVFAATGGKIAQTITFDAPNPMTRLSSYQSLTGTSTAGIQYTPSYSVTTPSICSYVGGAVVQTAVGTCVITATQAGDDIYLAATPVVRSFAVTRAPQTITIGTLNPMTRSSEDQTLVATSSEGLTPITFSTTSPACSIVAGKLRAVAAGTCSIVASQVGSDTIAAASAVRSGIVIAKDPQTINFIQPTGMRVGGSQQTLTATSSAGLTTTLSSLTPAVCSVVNRKIQPIKLGSCIIASDQLGNTNTAPAPRVLRTVTIRP
jgi:hypothetical protein